MNTVFIFKDDLALPVAEYECHVDKKKGEWDDRAQ